MVIIAGQKYACERCIRGHRVSQCTHTSEDLNKINPKGRPSSHCGHCRSHRKSRNAHVKCTCRRGSNAGSSSVVTAAPLSHSQKCQCESTLQCVCSSKARIQQPSLVDTGDGVGELKLPEKILAGGFEAALELARKIYGPEAVAQSSSSSNSSTDALGQRLATQRLSGSVDLRRNPGYPTQDINAINHNALPLYYTPVDASAPLRGGLIGYPAQHPSTAPFYAANGPYGPPPGNPRPPDGKPLDTYYGSIGLSEEPRYSRPLLANLDQKPVLVPPSQPAPYVANRKPAGPAYVLSESMIASGYPDFKALEQQYYNRSQNGTTLSSLERFEEQTDDEFWQWLANGGRASALNDQQLASLGARHAGGMHSRFQPGLHNGAAFSQHLGGPGPLAARRVTPPVSTSPAPSSGSQHGQQPQQPAPPQAQQPQSQEQSQQAQQQATQQQQALPQQQQQQQQSTQMPHSQAGSLPLHQIQEPALPQAQLKPQSQQAGQQIKSPNQAQSMASQNNVYQRLPRLHSRPSSGRATPAQSGAQPQLQASHLDAAAQQSSAMYQQLPLQHAQHPPGSNPLLMHSLQDQALGGMGDSARQPAVPLAASSGNLGQQSMPPQQQPLAQQSLQQQQPLAQQQQQQQQQQLPPSPERQWEYAKPLHQQNHGLQQRQPSPPDLHGQPQQPATISVPVQPQPKQA